MSENITKEMFAESLNTKFRLRGETPQPVELELVEFNEGPPSPRQEEFALLFRGPQNIFLPQATYQFSHDTLGELEMFLVPVGRDQQGFQYEAVFNRLREAE